MDTSIAFERVSTSERLALLDMVLHDLNLKVIGQYDFSCPLNAMSSIQTFQCQFTNQAHAFHAGSTQINATAEIAAKAEGVELYLAFQEKISTQATSTLTAWPEYTYFADLGWLPQNLSPATLHTPIRLNEYQSLTDAQSLCYPYELRYDCQTNTILDQYAHYTGLGFGINRDEALLHAIHEWTERDAYSSFLVNTFFHKNKIPLVDKATLPAWLLAEFTALEQQLNEQFIIVETTNDIGIPAFAVLSTKQDFIIQAIGMGASLNAAFAIHHALMETIQHITRRTEHTKDFWQKACQHYHDKPLLIDLMLCDIKNIVATGHIQKIAFSTIDSMHHMSLSEQVSVCCQRYQASDFMLFARTAYQHENGCHIMSVLIPGLQSLFLIKQAKWMPLSVRTKRLLPQRATHL